MSVQTANDPESRKTRSDANAPRYRTFAGTIARGMSVFDAQDRLIGEVDRVQGDQIVLVPVAGSDQGEYFVPLTLIDGIHEDRVLLAGRGDSTFGLGAEP